MPARPVAKDTRARRDDPFADGCARLGPRLMRDLGLTDLQAAGLLGNLGHESGGFRHLQEIRPAVKGSRGGWGLAQWTGPRRRAMEAWCRAEGLDPASEAANYGYLCEELRTNEAAARVALARTATLESATETVCLLFERPGVVALESRLAWARKALAALPRVPAEGGPGTDAAVPVSEPGRGPPARKATRARRGGPRK